MHTQMFPGPLLALTLVTLLGCPSTTGPDAAQLQPAPIPATPEPNQPVGGEDELAPGETTSPAPGPAPSDATEAETDALDASGAERTQLLEADPTQSRIGFAVARATTGHVGHFEEFSARLELVDEVPTRLEITVQTGSVVADRSGLTTHLQSPDFFDVGQFPTATFTTQRITPRPDVAPNSFELSGTMRLHGVGRKLEVETTIDVESDRVVGRAPLDISAKAFGIQYEGMEAELAEDAVQLEIELVFPRPKV